MAERTVRATWVGWCGCCKSKYPARTDIKRDPTTDKWVHADASECIPAKIATTTASNRKTHDDLYNEGGEGYNPYAY